MAPTEGRVAKPERQWGCRRSSPRNFNGRMCGMTQPTLSKHWRKSSR